MFLCGSSYFYGYSDAALSQDIRLPIHNGLLLTRCNLSLARCGKVAFPLFKYFNFSFMPKTMKDCSIAKHSTNTATLSHETGTFLEERNIQLLMHMFNTPQNYARHVGRLWNLRSLTEKAIGDTDKITEHKLFPLFDTINELVGCILRFDVHFDEFGRAYIFQNKQKVFI
jgi:hypothetical protein